MIVHNGKSSDTTDIASNSYLQINSCGIQIQANQPKITYRDQGRCDYHIIYIVDGSCEVEYDGKLVELKHGFVLFPPNIPQRYVEQKGTKKLWIHFNGYHVKDILNEANLTCGIHHVSPSPICEKLFVQIVAEHNQKTKLSNEKGLFLNFLNVLGKSVKNIRTTHELVNEAISFITSNYNTEISNEELAYSCNLSTSRFMHKFKEITGQSPHSYQQLMRINNAIFLLTSTNLSVMEIGAQVGYTDPLYFSRIFKKHTGTSPSEYRKSIST